MPDVNVEERTEPLTYSEWVLTEKSITSDENQLFAQYRDYVLDFYKARSEQNIDNATAVGNLYKTLINEITINYTSTEERRFLQNVDLNDVQDLDAVIPFYVKKIKQISKFLIRKREELKSAKTRHNLKGSVNSTKVLLQKLVLDLVQDEEFTSRFSTAQIPTLSTINSELVISIEPLYDDYQFYYDIDPSVSRDFESDVNRAATINYNANEIEPLQWLDFDRAVEKVFEKYPQSVTTDEGTVLKTSDNKVLQLNIPRTDINDLPVREFVNAEVSEDNLIINYQKELAEKFLNTKMYYVSTNSASESVSGVLFEPSKSSSDILNRYFPSTATVPSQSNLKTARQIGIYLPEKDGICKYAGFKLDIVPKDLDSDKIYVFPDTAMYATGRGSTLTDQDAPFTVISDVSQVKADLGNQHRAGLISDDEENLKLFPYQSREETLKAHFTGISRRSDSIDFWKGDSADVWANADLYEVKALEDLPKDERQEDLLVGDKQLEQWQTDIYGNEFAIFKKTRPQRLTTQQQTSAYIVSGGQSQTQVGNTVNPDGTMFLPDQVKYYDHSVSAAYTEYNVPPGESVTSDKTIAERRYDTNGDWYIRNYNSSIIAPASAILSAVFIKYNADTEIDDEIKNNVKNLFIYRNSIILETENYQIYEQYEYDFDSDTFSSVLPTKTFFKRDQPTLERFADPFYIEDTRELFICKTTIHPYLSASNLKAIYPQLKVIDTERKLVFDSLTVNTLSSSRPDTSIVSEYSVLSTLGFTTANTNVDELINISQVDRPSIYYNAATNVLSYFAIARDSSYETFFFNYYFNKQDEEFKPVLLVEDLNLLIPDHENMLNIGFGSWSAVSGLYIGDEIDFDASTTKPLCTYLGTDAYSLCAWELTNSYDSSNDTFVMGASTVPGLSAEGIVSYAHNASYVLMTSAIEVSAAGADPATLEDINVTFDFALYTNTETGSAAYFTLGIDPDIILGEDGNPLRTEDDLDGDGFNDPIYRE